MRRQCILIGCVAHSIPSEDTIEQPRFCRLGVLAIPGCVVISRGWPEAFIFAVVASKCPLVHKGQDEENTASSQLQRPFYDRHLGP